METAGFSTVTGPLLARRLRKVPSDTSVLYAGARGSESWLRGAGGGKKAAGKPGSLVTGGFPDFLYPRPVPFGQPEGAPACARLPPDRVKLWASAFGGEIKSIAAKYSGSQLLQKRLVTGWQQEADTRPHWLCRSCGLWRKLLDSRALLKQWVDDTANAS
ncbi:Voltage-dependent calcium channel subunit alpha-2/delta-3 [Tupaia chinensis]|uniref:Voltage-dependent calcium channel subunit alpha-2/delta-3 n=1 Tax=Tupaia chinensis TaxID=246437 RepID=L9L5R8_TUPCH|nr:Voltage-dependent calcium channel subunit alpha-2/delta-3 [Tupaia chinensis]